MGLVKKAEILLFPVAFAAGIVTGIVIGKTKKKAAQIAAVDGALNEELPAADTCEAQEEIEDPAADTGEAQEKNIEDPAEEASDEPETEARHSEE